VPAPAFRFLEYVFLALLYLFFLRVVRAVWVELREPRLVSAPQQAVPAPVSVTGGHAPVPAAAPSGKRGLPTQLVLAEGPVGTGLTFPLGAEITIGRAAGCAVALADDTFVSQLHARVFYRGDGYWVEDLGSTNGTLLNGRKVSGAMALRRGDRVQVGQSVLELRK
jgi:FHA domain